MQACSAGLWVKLMTLMDPVVKPQDDGGWGKAEIHCWVTRYALTQPTGLRNEVLDSRVAAGLSQ